MHDILQNVSSGYDRLIRLFNHFDGPASILLPLIPAPVLIGPGWTSNPI
jgi:hypothetical protein